MRKLVSMVLAVALALVLILPLAANADNERRNRSSIRGKVEVEGVVTSVAPGSSTFTMRVTKHARRVGSDHVVVLVQRATELKTVGRRGDDDDDDDDKDDERARRIATISDIRVGDRVKLEGFRLDDGRIVALKLEIKNRRIVAQQPEFRDVVAQGVVSAKGSNSLTVVSGNGISRLVLVTPATEVRGQRNSFAAIQPTDVVVVQGAVNADGTVSAQRIEVVSAQGIPSQGTLITGVITAKSTTGPQFLILDNRIAVNVTSDTRIIWGGEIRSFADLQVGWRITASGDPIRVGGITVGINARVISLARD